MGSNWNEQTGIANLLKWQRSWRQELYTDLGTDFRFIAHIEEITALETGEVIHRPRPQVVRSMSQVMTDPDVLLLNEILTRLIKKWMDEDEAARLAAELANQLPV